MSDTVAVLRIKHVWYVHHKHEATLRTRAHSLLRILECYVQTASEVYLWKVTNNWDVISGLTSDTGETGINYI